MSEVSRSILAARVTSVRARLIGSVLIILVLLSVAGILYSVALSRLNQAMAVMEEAVAQTNVLGPEQQAAVFAETEAARRAMREVPLAWGLLIAIAALSTTAIAVRSIAQPMERLTEGARRLAGGNLEQRVQVEWADEFGRLAIAFNEMADQLQVSYSGLESQVAERTADLARRTHYLEATADVARDATSVLDPQKLLSRVVNLVSERFGFYHTGIFLLDPTGECAVLQAASSEGGQQMLARGHRLRVGEENIVGYVIGRGEPRVALDVGTDAVLLDNLDFPHTRSGVALPLRARGEIIGALDVQSREPQVFSDEDEDVAVLQTLADQVAMAISNARLYDQAQHEITERKRAEEQLQRYAAELEQANEEVKQFAYIVSHDLRAPLVNLKGFAAELRSALEVVDSTMDTALPHLDEKQRQDVTLALQEDVPEALGFIDSSVTHMDRFIGALLKLSRLGHRELHLEPVDMEALVQATLESLAHQIEERQVEVTVGPLPKVVADRTSMEQIMGNILDNAVKYLDPDRPGQIEITAERSYDETTFRIRDNGRGIAKEDMDKVFAPFRRVGRQDVPGEGMGLPYVQALVRRHGGRIWCESELGVGTTFSFTISNHIVEGGNHV